MTQTLPIWFCKQVKTNRIYCKHFLNHALGRYRVFTARSSSVFFFFFREVGLFLSKCCEYEIFARDAACIRFQETRSAWCIPLCARRRSFALLAGKINRPWSDTCAEHVAQDVNMAELLWRRTLIALLPNCVCVRQTETVIFPRGDESWAVLIEIFNEVLRKLLLSNIAVIEKQKNMSHALVLVWSR